MNRLPAVVALAFAIAAATLVPSGDARAAASISAQGIVHGGFYSSVWNAQADVDAMTNWVGKDVTFAGTFHDIYESEGSNWNQNTWWRLEEAWQANATPVANLNINASAASIAAGNYDTAIGQWANRVQGWLDDGGGRSLFIAPLQEHNGIWTPYGCDPVKFKAAYARIRTIFRNKGMDETQVRWVWAPNGWTDDRGACAGTSLGDYYPGSSIVDVIGYSAYRWTGSETVDYAVGRWADALRAVDASKPYLVLQTAAGAASSKSQWITDMFAWAAADPNVLGIVWFNFDKTSTEGYDWRVWNSSSKTGIYTGWKTAMSSSSTIHQFPLTDWFQSGPLPFSVATADRWAGVDRFHTAVQVSQQTHPDGATTVYLAVGTNFPDAIAGGPAAAKANAPILLTHQSSLPDFTRNELIRLGPDRVVVLGGPVAVADSVLASVQAALPEATIDRLAGNDRFLTSVEISKDQFSRSTSTVYITTGLAFPDAVVAAPAAIADNAPLLLVAPTYLPAGVAAELDRLNPSRIVIVGDTSSVSTAVATALGSYGTVTRISGADRYAVSAAVSAANFSPGVAVAYVAVGDKYPDALSAGPATGSAPGPILLVRTTDIPSSVATELDRLNPGTIVILGGTAVVPDSIAVQLAAYIG